MTRRSLTSLAALTAAGLALSGCGISDWFSSSKPPPLPGKRVSVLVMQQKLEPDPRLAASPLNLPEPVRNQLWPQAGGYPDHAMGNLEASAGQQLWRTSIGTGSTGRRRLLTTPVVADDRLFVMDAEFQVSALDRASGKVLWQVAAQRPEDEGDAFGGGVAFADGKVIATTGYGDVVVLDPATGKEGWRQRITAPIRAAATVANGRVFVVTIDNQLFALQLSDGAILWNHTGIIESAGLLGATSAAVDNGLVVVPYSSGELFGLRVENGRVAWSDSLAAVRRVGALASLADIHGMPVIDHGLVVAISHSGRLVGIDARSGARAWEQEIGGIETPWSAGDAIFVLSNDQEVVALARQSGRVRWVSPLDRWEDPAEKSGPVSWSGPVMGNGKLWLASSDGRLVALDAAKGEIIEQHELPDGTHLPPIIADGALYILTDDGSIVAYR